MTDKVKRLINLVRELRGNLSQSKFAKKIGVDSSTVSLWESGKAFPDLGNLSKLAHLKGWTVEEAENYLLEGELPTDDPLEQILRKIKKLPSESLAKVSVVATTTLAERMVAKDKVSA